MANNFETAIDQMMTELHYLKETAIDSNVLVVDKSQISVESTADSNKLVIHLNLNESKPLNESSVCDNEEPDSGSDKTNANNGSGDQNSANDSKPNDNNRSDVSQQPSNQSFKGRTYRRTISESVNEVTNRGILKYSHNWVRRTVSESSCDFVDPDLDHLSVIYDSIDDIYSDDELYSEKKPKKNVRFSENVSKTVFRPNSSILGRKLKNQKRAKNRKIQNRKNSSDSTGSTESVIKDNFESERLRQDSGYDSEDNGLNDETNVSQKANQNKHNKSIEIETGIEKLLIV